jgi:hypothetical protein
VKPKEGLTDTTAKGSRQGLKRFFVPELFGDESRQVQYIRYKAFFMKPERIHLAQTFVRFIAPVFLSTQRSF